MPVRLAMIRSQGHAGQPQTIAQALLGGIQNLPAKQTEPLLGVQLRQLVPVDPDLDRPISPELLDQESALAGQGLPVQVSQGVTGTIVPRPGSPGR